MNEPPDLSLLTNLVYIYPYRISIIREIRRRI